MSRSADLKAELRARLRTRRADVEPPDRSAAAAAVAEHLVPLLDSVNLVAAFAATQDELDLGDLYERLLVRGVRLCFPRVVGPGEMVFAEVSSLDELRSGAFGIAEPDGPALDLADVDVFLIPGVAFDRRGGRLGFGGGYYDRALGQRFRGDDKVSHLIGIGYSWQVLERELPHDAWDVAVDVIVTEAATIRCPGDREDVDDPS